MFKIRHRYLYILLLGLYSYLNILFTEGQRLFGFQMHSAYLLLGIMMAVLLLWEGNRLLERHLPQLTAWLHHRVHPLIVFFLFSLVNVVAIAGLSTILLSLITDHGVGDWFFHFKISLGFVFRVNLFLNSINAIVYFMNQLKQSQIEAEQLKKQTLEAQFEALRSQINPHFLFNSLNVLAALVYKDADASAHFIQELAKVYRYLLNYQDKKIVELRDELDFLASYTYLLKIRFKDNLTIVNDIPDHSRSLYIAPASLQMLIENAIKHNVLSSRQPLEIRLSVEGEKYLMIENTLQEKQNSEPSTFIGLRNLRQRYQFISNAEVMIQKSSDRFLVKIPLIKLSEI